MYYDFRCINSVIVHNLRQEIGFQFLTLDSYISDALKWNIFFMVLVSFSLNCTISSLVRQNKAMCCDKTNLDHYKEYSCTQCWLKSISVALHHTLLVLTLRYAIYSYLFTFIFLSPVTSFRTHIHSEEKCFVTKFLLTQSPLYPWARHWCLQRDGLFLPSAPCNLLG